VAAQSSTWIEIAVAPSIDEPDMSTWLRERADQAQAQAQARHAGPIPPTWGIRVALEGTSYDYHLRVTASRDGAALQPQSEPITCECTSGELLTRLDAELARAVAELERTESSATPEVAVEAEPPPPVVETTEPPPQRVELPPRGGLGGPGIAGAVITAVGLGLLTYGITMTVMGDEVVEENPEFTSIRHNAGPTSYAMLGTGAGLVATGIVLIVVDQVVCKHRVRGCRRDSSASASRPRPAAIRF